jgi:hypothetical protein
MVFIIKTSRKKPYKKVRLFILKIMMLPGIAGLLFFHQVEYTRRILDRDFLMDRKVRLTGCFKPCLVVFQENIPPAGKQLLHLGIFLGNPFDNQPISQVR